VKRKRDEEAPPESDAVDGAPHPRVTTEFFGNEAAEQALLEAYRAGRLPQSWIIGGPEGIGKATLAWRFARFLFAYPDPAASEVRNAENLALPANHPMIGKVASLALGDLFVLRREWNEKARPVKHFTEIRVDDVRDAMEMFHLASASGGWRVCVIDCAEDLNKSGANALLKLIEEPPPRSLFLFIAQRPGQILPTIRSRSRLLMMQPLATDDVARAITAIGEPWSEFGAEIAAACAMSKGSVRKALRLLDEERFAFEQRLTGALAALPRINWRDVHNLGDKIAGFGAEALEDWEATLAAIYEWLDERVHATDLPPARLARYAEVWEKVTGAVRETEALNLDKRPLILSIFADLAAAEQAARR
jgi:DNA polymerase-3 subunit delta'